jgi:hypothetical protein
MSRFLAPFLDEWFNSFKRTDSFYSNFHWLFYHKFFETLWFVLDEILARVRSFGVQMKLPSLLYSQIKLTLSQF